MIFWKNAGNASPNMQLFVNCPPSTNSSPSSSSKMFKKQRISKTSVLAIGLAATISPVSALVAPAPCIVERQATRVSPASATGCVSTSIPGFIWDTEACGDSFTASWEQPIGDWSNPPKVNINVAGVPLVATVDTGSTGLVAAMSLFPNHNFTLQTPTSIFYSSSHWLEEGYEEWIDMTFGPYKMKTKILVKDHEVCCPTFDSTTDGHRCPASKVADGCICSKNCPSSSSSPSPTSGVTNKRLAARDPPAAVAYMGIGFGRGDPPIDNPFMNIVSFNDIPIGDALCQGYVITNKGITLGLNKENTEGFFWTSLEQNGTSGMRDWDTPSIQYTLDNNPETEGTLLVDTGIANSYFSNTPTFTSQSTFNVSFPGDSGKFTVRYDMSEGNTNSPNPMQPIVFGVSSRPGYINSGRKLLNCFELAYDSVGGNFGYRYLNDTKAAGCSDYVTVNF
ncbi:hypothetical protein AA313_de0208801 [Arthrobotrys entomopaga]|nr:hypothetical protein AA313_de0208801 [Arthrobotrys entomopaga]